jgi:hypothetical protein
MEKASGTVEEIGLRVLGSATPKGTSGTSATARSSESATSAKADPARHFRRSSTPWRARKPHSVVERH